MFLINFFFHCPIVVKCKQMANVMMASIIYLHTYFLYPEKLKNDLDEANYEPYKSNSSYFFTVFIISFICCKFLERHGTSWIWTYFKILILNDFLMIIRVRMMTLSWAFFSRRQPSFFFEILDESDRNYFWWTNELSSLWQRSFRKCKNYNISASSLFAIFVCLFFMILF